MHSSLTRSTMRGSRLMAEAMLVSGPVAISVTSSVLITVSTMKSTACLFCAACVGSGSTGPSRPVSPWNCGSVTSGATIGQLCPGYTPMRSATPRTSSTLMALRVTFSSVQLPPMVVIPSTSRCCTASMMPNASSCPGSQSRMTFFLFSIGIPPLVVFFGLVDIRAWRSAGLPGEELVQLCSVRRGTCPATGHFVCGDGIALSQ